MNYWRDRFESLEYQAPERPDTSEIDHWVAYATELVRPVRDLFKNTGVYDVSKVAEKPYNVICKVDANWYQQTHFNEKYTFAFQNIVTGERSPNIPFVNRDKLGIKDDYKNTGGPYPYIQDVKFPTYVITEHYGQLLRQLWWRKTEILKEYYALVYSDKAEFIQSHEDWWVVYNEYLQSDQWAIRREKRIEIDLWECQMCGATEDLRVHHVSYSNAGAELMDDLLTVCRSCHQKIHPNKQML